MQRMTDERDSIRGAGTRSVPDHIGSARCTAAGDDDKPMAIVVMGVCGSGKSVLGRELADSLEWPFVEGDDFHPPENVGKMSAGVPLDDDDRWGWLRSLAARMDDETSGGGSVVMACSALKRSYRDILRRPRTVFVYLDGSRDELERRLAARTGHFMKKEMLDSQLATLEPPDDGERHLRIDAGWGLTVHEEARLVLDGLGLSS